jgi:hypothetical protein
MKKTALLLILLCFTKLMAQQATVTSGGNATGSGGTISYSIGQVADKTQIGTTGTITQGVQQPFEIVTLNGSEFENIRLEAVIYPNPTTTNVTLKITNFNLDQVSYMLFDMNGKVLNEGKIVSEETVIDMDRYAVATYLLKVSSNSKALKTFKIIKN